MWAVEVNNLRKDYGQLAILKGIDFKIRQGEIYGFLGPNGSGKSTTVKILCGLTQPSSGAVKILGYDLKEFNKVRPKLGYMSQKFSLYDDLTVMENLLFYAGIYGISIKDFQKRKKRLFQDTGFSIVQGELVANLPPGLRQRLAFICSILHNPSVVFLDEPTSGVDPITRRTFWELLYTLAGKGQTFLITTHHMDEAEHCHRVGILHQGQLISQGDPASLMGKYKVQSFSELFLHVVEAGV